MSDPLLQAIALRDVFGGEGFDGKELIPIFRKALWTSEIAAKLELAEDLRIAEDEPLGCIGIKDAFAEPREVLGLAFIKEGDDETFGALGRSNWSSLSGHKGEKGRVLDSNRGYESWWVARDKIHVERAAKMEPVEKSNYFWIDSFFSVNDLRA